jgi:hypothetical protein
MSHKSHFLRWDQVAAEENFTPTEGLFFAELIDDGVSLDIFLEVRL